jgi:hypothetical protein
MQLPLRRERLKTRSPEIGTASSAAAGSYLRMTEGIRQVTETAQGTAVPDAHIGLVSGRLELQVCADCGAVQYSPREACVFAPRCSRIIYV